MESTWRAGNGIGHAIEPSAGIVIYNNTDAFRDACKKCPFLSSGVCKRLYRFNSQGQ